MVLLVLLDLPLMQVKKVFTVLLLMVLLVLEEKRE